MSVSRHSALNPLSSLSLGTNECGLQLIFVGHGGESNAFGTISTAVKGGREYKKTKGLNPQASGLIKQVRWRFGCCLCCLRQTWYISNAKSFHPRSLWIWGPKFLGPSPMKGSDSSEQRGTMQRSSNLMRKEVYPITEWRGWWMGT